MKTRSRLRIFDQKELELLHEGTLKILQNPGMRIMVPEFLRALKHKGAKVDESTQIVSFSAKLIEETIDSMRNEVENRTS